MKRGTGVSRLKNLAALMPGKRVLAAAIVIMVGLLLFLPGQSGPPPTPFQEFSQTLEKTGVIGKAIDLTKHAEELFVIGSDPQPYVARLREAGFKVSTAEITTGEMHKRGKRIYCSKEVSQFPFPASKEHRIILYLDDAGRIESVGSWLFSTWI